MHFSGNIGVMEEDVSAVPGESGLNTLMRRIALKRQISAEDAETLNCADAPDCAERLR